MSLDSMRKRMVFDGGATADERNTHGKYLSFKSSLENSYQAEWITIDKDLDSESKWRCLINPDKLTSTYDQKEISIDFNSGMKNGDVFYWDRTGDRWIVFLQKDEEKAYFRASCRRCKYQINGWWVYLKGPSESTIDWSKKTGAELNELNNTLFIYVTKTEEALAFFKRFKIVKFDGHNWRVAVSDSYSMDGIIECYLEEYFDNDMEDSMEVPEIVEPDTTQPYISGPQFVKPYDKNVTFSIVGIAGGTFVVNSSKVKISESTETSCKLNIITGKTGEFTVYYNVGEEEKASWKVTIQSL